MTLKNDAEIENELNPDTWAGYELPENYKLQLPWFNEILWDSKIHEHAGIKFRIMRMSWGTWNGYVFLPKGHVFHGKNMNDKAIEDLKVHGGVTYTAAGGGICSNDNDWILGFDTNHIYDFSPDNRIRNFNIFLDGCKNYKTHAYVVQETKNLIDSILFTMNNYI